MDIFRGVALSALFFLATFVSAVTAEPATPVVIAGHVATFDANGHLLPWISWNTALDREMHFYEGAPSERGYPVFVTTTFLDGDWKPQAARSDTIPATQNGMGIISYLKFYALRGKQHPATLAIARSMGDYLITEALTPDTGKYPRFPRSTGQRGHFPQRPDSGSQADHPYEIEPDKGAIAGYALVLLYDATMDRRYLEQALHDARVLAANQQPGDATHSPWPFRADYRSGAARGAISGDMSYVLRLYDALLAHGHQEFESPRAALWRWISRQQIPSAKTDGARFAQFFEDHDDPANRNAWAPLNLARYLLEKRDVIDPDWRKDSATLIDFVRRTFTHREFGVTVCHEQDEDHDAWGGINSNYGAVLAMYAIDEQGRPRDLFKNDSPGGWQEDAHTDVVHNIVDALAIYPAWGN